MSKKSRSDRTLKSVTLLRKVRDLRKVKLSVGGKTQKIDLLDEFRLTPSRVSSMVPQLAEQFLFWRSLLRLARKRLRRAEATLTETKHLVDLALRSYAEDHDETFAEWELKSRVEVHEKVMIAREELLKAQDETDLLSGVVSALSFRKTTLEYLRPPRNNEPEE